MGTTFSLATVSAAAWQVCLPNVLRLSINTEKYFAIFRKEYPDIPIPEIYVKNNYQELKKIRLLAIQLLIIGEFYPIIGSFSNFQE